MIVEPFGLASIRITLKDGETLTVVQEDGHTPKVIKESGYLDIEVSKE